jgi:hypothetical protein
MVCFTTAHGCLHMYEALQPLGERVLDLCRYGQYHLPPNTTKTSLDGWTDELSGNQIVKYMSGGPKNYAYEIR